VLIGVVVSSVFAMSSAYAVDVWEFRAQDILPILSEYKTSANFSANQQALWSQMESKTKTILRTRDERRQAIQVSIKKRFQDKSPELRDLAKLLDQDDIASAQENQALRESWMTMYDALNDAQRDALVLMLNDQLARVADKPKEMRSGGDKPAAGAHRGGKGGAGGMGGGKP
jgi:vacuolar-type H+-ATPase catalytic subunit A/Vma1